MKCGCVDRFEVAQGAESPLKNGFLAARAFESQNVKIFRSVRFHQITSEAQKGKSRSKLVRGKWLIKRDYRGRRGFSLGKKRLP